MKKRVYVCLLILTMMANIIGCGTHQQDERKTLLSDQETGIAESQEDETPTGEYGSATMMVYMVGSDLESQYASASMDIEEMLGANIDQENFHLLVCTGGSSMWWLEEIPNDACSVYEVKDGELNPLTQLSGTNMSEPGTLTEFLNYGQENYTSESYSLVLWNHGGGSMVGYGADENYDFDLMSTVEIGEAIGNSTICQNGNTLEWIGFDACLMGMVEVAHSLSPYARYMVASEEVESGYGWDYACLEELSNKEYFDGRKAGSSIANHYQDFYETYFEDVPDLTLSCLDLQQTDEVEQALDKLVKVAKEELMQNGYSKIAKIRQGTKRFGVQSDSSMYDSVDLYDLALRMEAQYPEESQELKDEVNRLVVEHVTNMENTHGVAIYFPYENKDYAVEWVDAYDDLGFSQEYTSFIKTFSTTLTGDNLMEWDVSETDPLPNTDGTGYYIQLTQEQMENYAQGYTSIWEDVEDDGEYVCWYRSSDVILQDDGRMESMFDGNHFTLVGEDGNDAPCMMMEIERTESYAKFAIPIIVFRDKDVFTVYAHVRIDENNPDGVIIGMYETLDAEESLLPPKQMFELKEGDVINTFLFCRQIKFDDQGEVMPFDTWESLSMRGYEMNLISGDLTLEKHALDTDGSYHCLFQIRDTQGNIHETNLVPLEN